MSLKKLINKCKKKDCKAQEELYRMYSGRFFTLCLKYSNSYEQAQDNLQDAFIKIFENINQYNGKGSFEGWMTRIIINTALKKHQKTPLFLKIEEDNLEEPEEELEVDEDQVSVDVLIEIIQDLPDRYRHVFNLYVMEGFSHKEIAEMLNISQGTSKSNLARARMKLQQSLKKHLQSYSVRSI